MITVLAEPGTLAPDTDLALADEEVHHLRVRRAAPESRIRLLDGAGTVAEGVVHPAGATVRIEVCRRVEPLPPLRLLVAAGDRDRFGWLVEKCAEVGVTELVPIETERSVAVASRIRPNQLPRLRRRARETIKQCGTPWAPVIGEIVPLAAAVDGTTGGPRWLADLAAETVGAALPPPAVVAVGPEGDWTPAERAYLIDAGFQPVRLGPHVMRFETAAVAAAVLARASIRGADHE